MNEVILVSGSNRSGNTEYILKKINENIENSNLILLKDKKIEYCKGCLACHYKDKCIINDDINDISKTLINSKLIIFGIPNYFDNVSGLFKNFIDRLHPMYKSEKLKDKKVIFIYIGGGNPDGTKIKLHQSIEGLVKYLNLDILNEFSLKALNFDEMNNRENEIDEIITKIKEIYNNLS